MYIMQLTHVDKIEEKNIDDTRTIENIMGKDIYSEKISQDDKKNKRQVIYQRST